MANIRDVAKRAQVSPATVSYVLNDRMDLVRPATRERVLQAVRDLNYRPRSLTTHRESHEVRTVGIVIRHRELHPLIAYPYYRYVFDGILSRAAQREMIVSVILASHWEDAERRIRLYISGQCDGVLLMTPTDEVAMLDALSGRAVPFVAIGSSIERPNIHYVDVDNSKGATLAMEHLIGLGHKRIAWIGGDINVASTKERREGYRNCLRQAQLEVDPELIAEATFTQTWGYERTRMLMNMPYDRRATALFCGNDEIAMGALKALVELGIRVPDEISVVGFDGTAIMQVLDIPLTTIHQPMQEVGALAVDTLFGVTERQASGPIHVRVQPHLILGKSSGPVPC